MPQDDAREIEAGLTARLEQLLDRMYPGWVYGKGKRSAFCAPKSGRDLGSFEVILTGPRRGSWFRNSQGVGGNPLNLIAYALTGDHKAYKPAFAEARDFLGITPNRFSDEERAAYARQQAEAEARARAGQRAAERAEALRKRDTREYAHELWAESVPLRGTPAERYLRARGIGFPLDFPALRCYPALSYPDMPGKFPALLCAVQGADSRFMGVWRIYVTEDGRKAEVPNPKLGLGPCSGGGVRIFPPQNITGNIITLNVCEGVETGLGVYGILGGREPVIAALSTSGVQNFQPPPGTARVLIWPDGDRDKVKRSEGRRLESPGLKAANALRDRLIVAGILAVVQPTPKTGMDYLDVYLKTKGENNEISEESREAPGREPIG